MHLRKILQKKVIKGLKRHIQWQYVFDLWLDHCQAVDGGQFQHLLNTYSTKPYIHTQSCPRVYAHTHTYTHKRGVNPIEQSSRGTSRIALIPA